MAAVARGDRAIHRPQREGVRRRALHAIAGEAKRVDHCARRVDNGDPVCWHRRKNCRLRDGEPARAARLAHGPDTQLLDSSARLDGPRATLPRDAQRPRRRGRNALQSHVGVGVARANGERVDADQVDAAILEVRRRDRAPRRELRRRERERDDDRVDAEQPFGATREAGECARGGNGDAERDREEEPVAEERAAWLPIREPDSSCESETDDEPEHRQRRRH